jgi:cyanate permease
MAIECRNRHYRRQLQSDNNRRALVQNRAFYGWLLLAFCIVIQAFTAGIGGYSFAFFVVPWMQEFGVQRSALMMFTSVLHNIGTYAVDIGVSQLQAGTAISLMALLMAAAKFGVGALADRVSHSLLYFVMLACVGVAMLLLASGSPFVALNVGVPLLGTATGGMLPLISAIIAHRFGPERFGAMMGVIMASAGFAGVAPAGVSLIRDISGDYNTAFAALLVLLLPAVFCFIAHQRLPAPRLQPAGG